MVFVRIFGEWGASKKLGERGHGYMPAADRRRMGLFKKCSVTNHKHITINIVYTLDHITNKKAELLQR